MITALGVDGRPLRRPIVFLDTSTLSSAFPGTKDPLTASISFGDLRLVADVGNEVHLA